MSKLHYLPLVIAIVWGSFLAGQYHGQRTHPNPMVSDTSLVSPSP